MAGARTAHRRAPPPSSREARLQGFWGPHPGAFGPPPVRFQCGGGEAKATRGHDTWCIGREV